MAVLAVTPAVWHAVSEPVDGAAPLSPSGAHSWYDGGAKVLGVASVLKAGVAKAAATVEGEAVALVRERIGPVAAFRTALVVERLPKTRSGKILRATMKKIAEREDYAMPATIEDPAALETIREAWGARRG